jgi:uncharacterized coiled-coil protein SlyX
MSETRIAELEAKLAFSEALPAGQRNLRDEIPPHY